MKFFKALFGSKEEKPEEKKKAEEAKNFDVLKYDGVRALRAGQAEFAIRCWRTRQTLWRAVQMLTQKLCCQTIHDCPKVVPLHYESE